MLARMQVEEMYDGTNEIKQGFRPKIKLADWIALENYIVSMAPESLPRIPLKAQLIINDFKQKPINIDDENGALFTYLGFEEEKNTMVLGDFAGELQRYKFENQEVNTVFKGTTAITWYNRNENFETITEVGILDPSELEQGKISVRRGADTLALTNTFHRPVHNLVKDLNKDGNLEMVVSEFGNETGRLSLLVQKDSVNYEKKILLNQPGCIRTMAHDMDKDGKLDLVTLTSQGNESITVLYQKENLKFEAEKVLQFSPVYGSSWFEIVDYNNDGYDDIVTVNGDNADKSYVHKPYHGLRIHLNDGQNTFSESFFYPIYGATRFLAHDFDQDDDLDFAVISSFPDYENAPELSFVYLENKDSNSFKFKTKVLNDPNVGRWFLMDKGDVDNDGDMDILLSSFTYVFTPVPEDLSKFWSDNNLDVLLLENLLNH